MAKDNLVSVQFQAADLEAIKGAFTVLDEKLVPKLIDLNKTERRTLLKMGDKSLPFVEKALEYALTNGNLLPNYVNVAEMKTDLDAVKTLTDLYRSAEKITDMLDDTILLSGSEAFQTALNIYKAVQQAAKSGIEGAEIIFADLKQRFEKSKEKTPETPAV